ncbi:hypothetical protein NDU88_007203 [Pleurodeles waltl]|uniref:Uncharacterized protein n=1 Tax=Pleurodeles waltl TaxID=8319 RepID=A0AAV7QLC5_PLEWA|nr:hypothetical protein NDU88_007203 [Pleurodeles waltl]
MVNGLLGVLTAARGKRREKSEGDDGWTERLYWGRLETVELIVFYPSKIKRRSFDTGSELVLGTAAVRLRHTHVQQYLCWFGTDQCLSVLLEGAFLEHFAHANIGCYFRAVFLATFRQWPVPCLATEKSRTQSLLCAALHRMC